MGYLPETRRHFSGPRDAASAFRRVIERAPWNQKPLALALAVLAVMLASARRMRRLVGF